jgi:hypothetical protein
MGKLSIAERINEKKIKDAERFQKQISVGRHETLTHTQAGVFYTQILNGETIARGWVTPKE